MGFPTFQSVRMYRRNGKTNFAAAPCTYVRSVSPKRRYIGKMLIGRAYISGQKSRQVKSAKFLTDGRNGFTESYFSEQQSSCAEEWGITRFETKSRGFGKSTPLTYEKDIARRFSSGFQENRILHHTAKQVFGNRNPLRCFHHENLGGFL